MIDRSDDIFGAAPRKTAITHEIGGNLDSLSVEDIDKAILLLLQEIERLKAARELKINSKSAADLFFKA